MKVLCLVCDHAGHLDFGGNGFLTLAQSLINRGHTVHWLSPEANAKRLKAKGFKAAASKDAGNLFLIPMLSAARVKQQQRDFKTKLNAISALINTAKKYDLIICDRLLAFGPVLANKVKKPIVVIGAPATHFQLTPQFPIEVAQPVEDYLDVGKLFAKQLNCKNNTAGSFWAQSVDLNICFTSKNFYQFANHQRSAFIHHFESNNEMAKKSQQIIGFSFGNTGEPANLLQLIVAFSAQADPGIKIQVYAGRDSSLLSAAQQQLPSDVEVFGWIDFRKTFKTLSALVCYGGIGTLWEAANCAIPVATLPNIGDQLINSLAVERLQLGYMLDIKNITSNENMRKLNDLVTNPLFQANSMGYKAASNFSDDFSSACAKIEKISAC
jgi:UDP:flavonoid glycosyltransferase YjiC (YdhE family)